MQEIHPAAYKRHVAGLYDRAAPIYGTLGLPFFARAGQRLVELAGLTPGSRVLDIGTGRGAVLFPAAEAVGPTGHVLGIDISEAMVRETAADAARRGLKQVDVRVMDAERLDMPDASFDAVLSSFAVFFLPNLEEALLGFRRALRPGGAIGVALGGRDGDPRWRWENDVVVKHATLPSRPAAITNRRIHDHDGVAKLLTAAGFTDVRYEVEWETFAYRDAEEWIEARWTHGAREALESMSPETLAAFKAEAFAHLARMAQEPEGLSHRLQLVYTFGRRRDA